MYIPSHHILLHSILYLTTGIIPSHPIQSQLIQMKPQPQLVINMGPGKPAGFTWVQVMGPGLGTIFFTQEIPIPERCTHHLCLYPCIINYGFARGGSGSGRVLALLFAKKKIFITSFSEQCCLSYIAGIFENWTLLDQYWGQKQENIPLDTLYIHLSGAKRISAYYLIVVE